MLLILLAPLFSLIAVVGGAVVTAVAILLNGPRRLKDRGEAPYVVLPPVPSAEMRQRFADRDRTRSAL